MNNDLNFKPVNLTLCDWNQPGEEPCIDIEHPSEIRDLVHHWLRGKRRGRVYVCFDSWRDSTNEYPTILVTSFMGIVADYADQCVKYCELMKFDFNIYEFATWEAALEYCQDLKEGL